MFLFPTSLRLACHSKAESQYYGALPKDTNLADVFGQRTWVYVTRTNGQLQAVLWSSEYGSNSKLAGRSRLSVEITAVTTSHWKELGSIQGIQIKFTTPYTAHQNGVSERLNRALVSAAVETVRLGKLECPTPTNRDERSIPKKSTIRADPSSAASSAPSTLNLVETMIFFSTASRANLATSYGEDARVRAEFVEIAEGEGEVLAVAVDGVGEVCALKVDDHGSLWCGPNMLAEQGVKGFPQLLW
ncbi:hypothetical protein V496_01459, partial [Pseudogymnoascus sp. VKM F-4515 (FW-2607)]